jgi:thiamine-monophosphate kinase
MPSEFDIIKRYFNRVVDAPDIALGIGDDAALLQVPEGQRLVVTADTLVENVHFPEEIPPEFIGHKALAVNLSDLAAMGATPKWVTLAITLPEVDEVWLEGFCRGFFALADRYQVHLVGGDTTRGPLSMTVQAMGWVPEQQALLRSGARPGDQIYASGSIGDAGIALRALQGKITLDAEDYQDLILRLHRPSPRIELGLSLRGLASSCIDVSDGLMADLGHILQASGVGAEIDQVNIPFSEPVLRWIEAGGDALLPMTLGDDYELVFTIAPHHQEALDLLARELDLRLTLIGTVVNEPGITLFNRAGEPVKVSQMGFNHFGTT